MSISHPTSNPNSFVNSSAENYSQIFDDDVQRYEATEYKQRYGERWKKLATSVRDVVQPDGTIIREYVIEDPSLLEQLSEDEDNQLKNEKPTSSFNQSGQTTLPLKSNIKNSSSFKLYSSNKNNNSANTIDINDKGEKYFQPIISKKEEEEIDKEVETIHEQGEQFKKYVSEKDLAQSVEYEIVDENGNQILLNGAEQLKNLAAQVNEVVQPDGSIVKEYVLNDPKIIEQIRNRIRAQEGSNNNQMKEESVQVSTQIPNNKPLVSNNFDTMSTTNATIASITNDKCQLNKNINETILTKNNKPVKQEEFINAWCNDKPKAPSPQSLPFLSQIQYQLQKLQKKNTATDQKSNETVQNKITSQLSDKYIAEIDYQQSMNNSKKTIDHNLKQINPNIFQLKTKKGKALKFTITSDDPTESDIEEVKFIINKSIENLAENYETDNKDSFKNNKKSTLSAHNFNSSQCDQYIKSSSFQPGPYNAQQKTNINETSSCSNNSNNQVPKSGSIGCFKNNQSNEPTPKNFLNANNSQIKHYPNMNPVNNSNKVYHGIENTKPIYSKQSDEKRYSKELYSSNSGSNENLYSKHQPSYQTHDSVINKNNSKYLLRSSSFGTNQDSASSDTDLKYARNNTSNKKNNIKTNNKSNKKQNIFNGGTYTKSTINFTSQSYDSDFNDLEESKKDKQYSKQMKNKSTKSSHNYGQMNRSVNNIYDSKQLRDVTPEMTEQLLLKLLLQQISQTDQTLNLNLPSFTTNTQKRSNIKDDYSSSSTIYNKNIVSEAASLMMSPVDSSYSSKFNSIKNKLTHKSKNNFEFEVDDDFDDISTTNQFRRYQPNSNAKTSQYVTQQQLMLKKPQSRSKKYTN